MTIYEMAYIIMKFEYFFHEISSGDNSENKAKEMKERYSAIFNTPLVIGGIVYMGFKLVTIYKKFE